MASPIDIPVILNIQRILGLNNETFNKFFGTGLGDTLERRLSDQFRRLKPMISQQRREISSLITELSGAGITGRRLSSARSMFGKNGILTKQLNEALESFTDARSKLQNAKAFARTFDGMGVINPATMKKIEGEYTSSLLKVQSILDKVEERVGRTRKSIVGRRQRLDENLSIMESLEQQERKTAKARAKLVNDGQKEMFAREDAAKAEQGKRFRERVKFRLQQTAELDAAERKNRRMQQRFVDESIAEGERREEKRQKDLRKASQLAVKRDIARREARFNYHDVRNKLIASGADVSAMPGITPTSTAKEIKAATAAHVTYAKQLGVTRRQLDATRFSMNELTKSVTLAGKRLGAYLAFSVPLYAAFAAFRSATADAIEFEKILTKIEQSTSVTEQGATRLGMAIRKIGADNGISGTDLGKGAFIFAQAGFQDLKQLESITKLLAKTQLAPTFGDIDEVARGLIATFGQFNKQIGNTAEILDLVNQYANDFAVDSKELFEGIVRGGASFAAVGGNLEEFIQLFTVLESATRASAETLGVFFKTASAQINSKKSQAILASLGIDKGSITDQIKDLARLFSSPVFANRSSDKFLIAESLVGIRQVGNLTTLLNELGKKDILDKLDQSAKKVSGSLDRSIIARLDDVGIQFKKVGELFNSFFTTLIKSESARSFAASIHSIAESLSTMGDKIIPVITELTKLLAIMLAFKGLQLGRKVVGNITGLNIATFRAMRSDNKPLINMGGAGMGIAGVSAIAGGVAMSGSQDPFDKAVSAGLEVAGTFALLLAGLNPLIGAIAAVTAGFIGFQHQLDKEMRYNRLNSGFLIRDILPEVEKTVIPGTFSTPPGPKEAVNRILRDKDLFRSLNESASKSTQSDVLIALKDFGQKRLLLGSQGADEFANALVAKFEKFKPGLFKIVDGIGSDFTKSFKDIRMYVKAAFSNIVDKLRRDSSIPDIAKTNQAAGRLGIAGENIEFAKNVMSGLQSLPGVPGSGGINFTNNNAILKNFGSSAFQKMGLPQGDLNDLIQRSSDVEKFGARLDNLSARGRSLLDSISHFESQSGSDSVDPQFNKFLKELKPEDPELFNFIQKLTDERQEAGKTVIDSLKVIAEATSESGKDTLNKLNIRKDNEDKAVQLSKELLPLERQRIDQIRAINDEQAQLISSISDLGDQIKQRQGESDLNQGSALSRIRGDTPQQSIESEIRILKNNLKENNYTGGFWPADTNQLNLAKGRIESLLNQQAILARDNNNLSVGKKTRFGFPSDLSIGELLVQNMNDQLDVSKRLIEAKEAERQVTETLNEKSRIQQQILEATIRSFETFKSDLISVGKNFFGTKQRDFAEGLGLLTVAARAAGGSQFLGKGAILTTEDAKRTGKPLFTNVLNQFSSQGVEKLTGFLEKFGTFDLGGFNGQDFSNTVNSVLGAEAINQARRAAGIGSGVAVKPEDLLKVLQTKQKEAEEAAKLSKDADDASILALDVQRGILEVQLNNLPAMERSIDAIYKLLSTFLANGLSQSTNDINGRPIAGLSSQLGDLGTALAANTAALTKGLTVVNELEIKPIMVNVALSVPDIAKMAGPEITNQVVAAIKPALLRAFSNDAAAQSEIQSL